MSVVNMIKGLIRLTRIMGESSDDKKFPIHQVEYMGKLADAYAWYPFGYHANPGNDVLAIMLAVSSNSENRVIMPGSPEERLDDLLPTPLAEGEVLFFNPLTKSHIHLKANGDINVNSVGKTTITGAGTVEIDGDTLVDLVAASIEASDGGSTESLCNEAFLAKFNSHSHAGAAANDTVAVIGTDTTSVLKAE